jgi:hypothetical protein
MLNVLSNNYFRKKWKRRTKQVVFVLIVWDSLSMTTILFLGLYLPKRRGEFSLHYTDKKENQIFLIYQEIHTGAAAKSYMSQGFLIYEEMHKYLVIFE